jgi:oligopeptide/dipeptide ABC transporter ATP-binding protein
MDIESLKKKVVDVDYSKAKKILEVKDLRVSFKSDSGIVHAVRGVSFNLYKGETLCIVGESGSGKSVTSKTIMGILPVNAIIESGQIIYDGEDLVRVSEEEFHRIRGHKIGMIFQDPLSSLNPIMKIGKQIIEATMINRNILKRKYAEEISKELVAVKNIEANSSFEKRKCKDELERIDYLLKRYKDSLKDNEISQEDKGLAKVNDEINEYFAGVKASAGFIYDSYLEAQEQLTQGEKKVKVDDILAKSISELMNRENKKLLNYYKNVSEKNYSKDNPSTSLIARKEEIKELMKLTNESKKELLPLLRKALRTAKKKAKLSVLKYAEKLKEERDLKLKEIDEKLKEVDLEIADTMSSFNEEETTNYRLFLEEKKKEEKEKGKNSLVGLAKATVKDRDIYELLPDSIRPSIQDKEKLEKNKVEVLDDYINKTKITRKEAKKIALSVMKEVGISFPEQRFKQYPFELSGGMRQRIVIAIALTANPEILICDEPTTALDVTIQAQILELINKLKKERGLSCIFITHDLGVVANMADRVAVMYAGKIVEYGTSFEVFFEPKHPYTWALLSSIPDIDSKEKLESIPGTPPDLRFPPAGDAFAARSRYALEIDFAYEPPFFKVSDTHYAATWLLYKGAPKVEMPKIVKTRIDNALKGAMK